MKPWDMVDTKDGLCLASTRDIRTYIDDTYSTMRNGELGRGRVCMAVNVHDRWWSAILTALLISDPNRETAVDYVPLSILNH